MWFRFCCKTSFNASRLWKRRVWEAPSRANDRHIFICLSPSGYNETELWCLMATSSAVCQQNMPFCQWFQPAQSVLPEFGGGTFSCWEEKKKKKSRVDLKYPLLSVLEVGATLHFHWLGWGLDPGSWQISISHFQGHYIWLRIGHLIKFRPMREWCLGHICMFFRMFQWQVGSCWGPGCGSQESS